MSGPHRTGRRLVGWLMAALMLVAGALASPPAFADDTGSISGVVTDAAGAPVEGVSVTAYVEDPMFGWNWAGQAMSGFDGSYTLEMLPDGEYRVEFSTASSPVNVTGEWWADAHDLWSATSITVAGGAAVGDISPTLEAGGSVSGLVTDASGAPLPYMSVSVQSVDGSSVAYGQTDENGEYMVTGIIPGDHFVEFTGYGAYGTWVSEWWDDAATMRDATAVTVHPGSTVESIDAVLAKGSTVSGVVTDHTGAPVSGVNVELAPLHLDGGEVWGWTDESGRYTLEGVRAGDYTVRFHAPYERGDIIGEWWTDAHSEDDAATLHVTDEERVDGIDASLDAAGAIAGQVVDAHGAPVVGAGVYVYQHDAVFDTMVSSTMTDETGSFTAGALAPGEYKIRFEPGYDNGSLVGEWFDDAADIVAAHLITVGSGGTATADAELAFGASVSGVVTDEAGLPVGEVTVAVMAVVDGYTAPATMTSTDADGSYSLTGLAAGDYKVQFTTDWASANVVGEWWDDSRTEADAAVLTLAAGEAAADISPRLATGAEISGRVVDADGVALANVSVAAIDGDSRVRGTAWTGEDGTYAIRGLEVGAYRVSFQQDREGGTQLREWWDNAVDYASADPITVAPAEVVSGVDVILSESDGSIVETFGSSLGGTVTDAAGQPIPGARVVYEGAGGWFGADTMTDASGVWSFSYLPAGTYTVSFTAEIDGTTYTQWWDGAADRDSATVITLARDEERTGIDAVVGPPALPVLTMAQPKITGPELVGKALRAHVGKRDPGTEFSYVWFADGQAIAGVEDDILILTPDLQGARISVRVTGSKAGYQALSLTSAETDAIR